ncbi:hypothetical protein DY000_02033924 [Brassica cretica]|uniref:Uncharacterized protein n=1 Tax=Brassica cretica TaxID=69181 RepID=A0ABQ7DD79_BRACR|nr:hypothetical protein DY000_02033924 [Brassica cretica]
MDGLSKPEAIDSLHRASSSTIHHAINYEGSTWNSLEEFPSLPQESLHICDRRDQCMSRRSCNLVQGKSKERSYIPSYAMILFPKRRSQCIQAWR